MNNHAIPLRHPMPKWACIQALLLPLLLMGLMFSIGRFEEFDAGGEGGTTSKQTQLIKAIIFSFSILITSYMALHATIRATDIHRIIRIHWPLWAYMLYTLLSIFFAAQPEYSMRKWVIFVFGYIATLSLIVQYYILYGHIAFQKFSTHMLYTATMLIVLPMISVILNGPSEFISNPRYHMGLQLIHPNLLSATVYVMLLHCWFYPATQHEPLSQKLRLIRYILLVWLPIMLVMLFSRGAILAFILGLVITLIWLTLRYRYMFHILVCLMLVLGVSCFFIMVVLDILPLSSLIAMIARSESGVDVTNLTGRTDIWNYILDNVTTTSLIIGHGFAVMAPDVGFSLEYGTLYGAHNTYLMILTSNGIIGLLLYLLFFIRQLTRIRQASYSMPIQIVSYPLCLVYVFLVHSVVDTFFSLNMNGIFAMILMVLTLLSLRPLNT